MEKKVGLYWFTQDLRVQNNPIFSRAARDVSVLICVFFMPRIDTYLERYSRENKLGSVRVQFLLEALLELNLSLSRLGQKLIVVRDGYPDFHLNQMVKKHRVTHFYCDEFVGEDERCVLATLRRKFPAVRFYQEFCRTIFTASQLPFDLKDFPKTFTQFRKCVESLDIDTDFSPTSYFPSPAEGLDDHPVLDIVSDPTEPYLRGGELSGSHYCQQYFLTRNASTYKETRNQLDGQNYSTNFSPWLALGCVSPRDILAKLTQYERKYGANSSTYWITFELLWREYFYWYARCHGTNLFRLSGVKKKRPLTSFYGHRFLLWKKGKTPYPIVNACMNQLSKSGYMSNRGRQLCASCLVNELQVDWRYGAAYFETQLIDNDVSSNWGNWQYIAGVGAGSEGPLRHFNLEKQTQRYDPHFLFIDKWRGRESKLDIDVVDVADWPTLQ